MNLLSPRVEARAAIAFGNDFGQTVFCRHFDKGVNHCPGSPER